MFILSINPYILLVCLLNIKSTQSVKLHDPRYRTTNPSDFEPIVFTPASFLEATSEPNSQIEAPGRLDCDCEFVKANPLGRPNSEFHQGRIESSNEPTKLKFEKLAQNDNPNGKVEDTVANLLSSNNK
jgi:hypothetical protein